MAKICGIYCFKNKINSKRYIGQSTDVIHRKYAHLSDLKNNKHHNDYFQKSFNKYGESNFEFLILAKCSINELDDYEKYFIDKYNTFKRKYGYNLESGGNKNKIISVEVIEQQAQSKSVTTSTTGIRRVSKIKLDSATQGFIWIYQYREKGMDFVVARSANLLELEKKVKNEGFPWIIVNEKKAEKSYEENEYYLSKLKRKAKSGFFRVSLIKSNYKNNYYGSWSYSYYEEGERKSIGAPFLEELKEKVLKKGLEWFILDAKLANISLKKNEELKNNRIKNRGTTNYYRVSVEKCNGCKDGILYVYSYQKDKKRKRIRSTDLKKLEKKVKEEGLVWMEKKS